MINPVGMNNSAMNVDRIRVPRRNNAMSDVSFSGLNTQKVQDGAKSVLSTLGKYAKVAKDNLVKFVKSDSFQEGVQKFKKGAVKFLKATGKKAGEVFNMIKDKVAAMGNSAEKIVDEA